MRQGIRMKGIQVVTIKKTGKRYIYHRESRRPLPDLPENHPEFLAAFLAAEQGNAEPRAYRAREGTIGWMVQAYQASHDWSQLSEGTKRARRLIFNKIVAKAGTAQYADLMPRHIRKDLDGLTPAVANNRLRCWRGLCKWAVKAGKRDDNPAREVEKHQVREQRRKRWEPERVEQFRAYWPLGTQQRLAFEILYWTGARCCDVRLFGRQHIVEGWLEFKQNKTGGGVNLPWTAPLPEWAYTLSAEQKQLIEALPQHDHPTFIATWAGAPRSEKAISSWFSEAASKAGLPDGYTAHGLRDTRCAILAEIGASSLQLMTWSGHKSLSEVQKYIEEADRAKAMRGGNKLRKVENSKR